MMEVVSVVRRGRDGVRGGKEREEGGKEREEGGKEREEGGRASEWDPIYLSIFSFAKKLSTEDFH